MFVYSRLLKCWASRCPKSQSGNTVFLNRRHFSYLVTRRRRNLMGHAYEIMIIFKSFVFVWWTQCVVYMINSKDFHLSGRVLLVIFINFSRRYRNYLLLYFFYCLTGGQKLRDQSWTQYPQLLRCSGTVHLSFLKNRKICAHTSKTKISSVVDFVLIGLVGYILIDPKLPSLGNFFIYFNGVKFVVDEMNAYSVGPIA